MSFLPTRNVGTKLDENPNVKKTLVEERLYTPKNGLRVLNLLKAV
jgi:hypothetical protein